MESMVAIIGAAAAIMMPVGYAKHAPDGAHRSANAGADRTTYHFADRTGRPAPLIRPLLCAAYDALSVGDVRNGEQSESDAGNGKSRA